MSGFVPALLESGADVSSYLISLRRLGRMLDAVEAALLSVTQPTRPIVPVVLSGGSGSRLWPVSRASFPKQLWPLLTERTMLQETVLRARGAGFAAPVLVCNEEHRFLVAEQMREAKILACVECYRSTWTPGAATIARA